MASLGDARRGRPPSPRPYTAGMKRQHNPLRLDLPALSAEGAVIQGEWPGAALTRLAEGQTPPQDLPMAMVAWQASGSRQPVAGSEDQLWLALHASTTVWLTCQRCLQPMAWPLNIDRRIRFVRSEAEAEQLDAEHEDDVLALGRFLNVQDLVEDELLLASPLVPRHEVCPQAVVMSVGEDDLVPAIDAPANPFAVLKSLKKGRGPAE